MKLFKNFFVILELPINLFWSVSKAEIERSGPCNIGSRLGNAIFGWRIQNHFFWKNRRNLGTLPKFSPYTGVSYNVVLKCVKGRNRIFGAIEYWCKTLECQIWSTIRKLFSWESETKLQILQKRSLYVGVSYKLFWSLSKAGIFWVIEYWLKALECQIWLTNTKKCFCES